ncbi:MAG TPA: rhodanese-like domain-containing protein [Gemmatimonadales bacterium]
MTIISALAGLVILSAGVTRAEAQTRPRDRLIVTTTWLAEHLEDEHLVLLHVGEEYEKEHISGAQPMLLRDISSGYEHEAPLTLELMAPEDLRDVLQRFGVTDASRIVVYFGADWVTASTRIMFALHAAGLGDRASLLDGGMPAWKAAGHPVTDVATIPRVGRLSPLHPVSLVVDAVWVQAHKDQPGYALVDGRAAIFYDGVRETGAGKGHVAGAGSLPFTEVFDDELRLASPAALEALLARAGVQPGDTVVAYCHIGQQATAAFFAARSLGYPYRLYDGSMDDWGKRGLPLVTPGEHR